MCDEFLYRNQWLFLVVMEIFESIDSYICKVEMYCGCNVVFYVGVIVQLCCLIKVD